MQYFIIDCTTWIFIYFTILQYSDSNMNELVWKYEWDIDLITLKVNYNFGKDLKTR